MPRPDFPHALAEFQSQHLNAWLKRTDHGVSPKHLPNCVNEYVCLA